MLVNSIGIITPKLICCLLLIEAILCQQLCNVSFAQYDALKSFFNATNGHNWTWNLLLPISTRWSFTNEYSVPCYDEWQGLTCTRVAGDHLCDITAMGLADSNLKGTIPWTIGSLTGLSYIDLSANHLGGAIPTQFGYLSNLETIYLYENSLSGAIPSSISNILHVDDLQLYLNRFSGAIPEVIGLLTRLNTLDINSNQLTGTIPSEIANLNALRGLYLYGNHFNGSIPSYFGNLQLLETLNLNDNSLSGTIPTTIAKLKLLVVLHLQNNLLTGIIPATFAQLSNMEYLVLSSNLITGPIPVDIGSLHSLVELYVDNNLITGSIPNSLGNLSSLVLLYLNENYLGGEIPMSVGFLSKLKIFYLYANDFDGTIPASLGGLKDVEIILMYYNHLSGNLPTAIGNLTNLQDLFLYANKLSGAIPSEFGLLSSLQSLYLYDNALTGVIPTEIGSLINLKALNLGTNCFEGTFPNICSCLSLEDLDLNGMSSAAACTSSLFPGLGKIIAGKHSAVSMTSSVPNCLWTLPNISSVSFAGNSFTGTLGILPNTSKLVSLIVTNNKIHGNLPKSLQEHGKFTELMLSSNMLDGTLLPTFAVSSNTINLNLSYNRLSGNVPASVALAQQVDVLAGNVFGCDKLPENDVNAREYSCGSTSFDTSASVFSCLVSVCIMLLVVLAFTKKSAILKLYYDLTMIWRCDMALTRNTKYWKLRDFVTTVQIISKTAVTTSTFTLLIGLPCFVAFKMFSKFSSIHSTHEIQYGWTTTATYLHGLGSVFTLFVLVMLPLFGIIKLLTFKQPLTAEQLSAKQHTGYVVIFTYLLATGLCLLQVLNMAVSLTVNIAYVVTSLKSLPVLDLMLCQFALGAFKVVWSTIISQMAIGACQGREFSALTTHLMGFQMFNFVIAPLLATILTDGNCFYFAIMGNPPIYSTIDIQIPIIVNGQPKIISSSTSTETNSPWLYYNQCGSAVITNYVPVLMFSYCLSGIIIPSISIVYILSPFAKSRFEKWLPVFVLEYLVEGSLWYEGMSCAGDSAREALTSTDRCMGFTTSMLLSGSLVHLTVLLTFGIACPLLSVAATLSIITQAIIYLLLLICILRKTSSGDISETLQKLEDRISFAANDVCISLPVLFVLVIVFWTGLFLDMTLDDFNIKTALTISIVMGAVLPVVVNGVHVAYSHFHTTHGLRTGAQDHDNNDNDDEGSHQPAVEMSPVMAHAVV